MRKLMLGVALTMLTAGCGATASDNGTTAAGAVASGQAALRLSRVPLPGEGRGDYVTVDADARRLYVTHASVVHILDLDSLRQLAQVDGLKAAHGVAVAGGHGFVTDGGQSAVVQFDPTTGKLLKVIPAGDKPDSIVDDAVSGKIFAFNNESATVTVIDPATGTIAKTIKLPHGPEASLSDGRGKLWVNMEEGNSIAVIDARSMTLAGTIPLTGCEGPTPLAFDAANRLLFSGCGNGVMVVTDADAGKVIATVPIDAGGDADGIAYDAERKRVVVANRNGGWTIVRQDGRADYTVEPALPIDAYAKTVALDPRTHRLFSSTADLVWPPAVPGKKHLPNAKSGTFRLMVVSER